MQKTVKYIFAVLLLIMILSSSIAFIGMGGGAANPVPAATPSTGSGVTSPGE